MEHDAKHIFSFNFLFSSTNLVLFVIATVDGIVDVIIFIALSLSLSHSFGFYMWCLLLHEDGSHAYNAENH